MLSINFQPLWRAYEATKDPRKRAIETISMMSSVVREDTSNVVQRVGRVFHRLEGKNLLITGGTGFVGSHLIETIAFLNDAVFDKPCRVFVVARNPKRLAEVCPHLASRDDLILSQGDVRTFKAPSGSCDYIIHAACPADPQAIRQNTLETMNVIVEGTRRMLDLAVEKRTEGFLFLSSGAIYGPQPPDLEAIPEDYQGGPDLRSGCAGYGEAKRHAEILCQAFRETKGVPVSVARLFAFVGPYQDLNSSFAVADFLRQALQGQTIRVKGDGKAVRTLCYSADMVVALWKILACGKSGDVYNVGSDRGAVSIRELAVRVAKLLGSHVEVVVEGRQGADTIRPRYVPDITKLKEEIGFTLSYDLDSALMRTIAHLREQPLVGPRQQLTQ
jgi:dTDP-glucose 4,6-dehydratase